MAETVLKLLLADDDEDDRLFFQQALAEIPLPTRLSLVSDGERLMHTINASGNDLPDIIFLDLNMPRKNGFDCLKAIKLHEQAKDIPVVVISTSQDEAVVAELFAMGAYHYITKPSTFPKLKLVIHTALNSVVSPPLHLRQFVLNGK